MWTSLYASQLSKFLLTAPQFYGLLKGGNLIFTINITIYGKKRFPSIQNGNQVAFQIQLEMTEESKEHVLNSLIPKSKDFAMNGTHA